MSLPKTVTDTASDNPLFTATYLRQMLQTPNKVPFIPGDYLVKPAGLVLPIPPQKVLKTKPIGELKELKVKKNSVKIIR